MLSRKWIFIGKFAAIGLFCSMAHAEFGIKESPAQYGDGQAGSFSRAINSDNEEISPTERQVFKAAMPEPGYNRWYGRVNFNIGKIELRAIKNKTAKGTPINPLLLSKKSTNANQVGLEFALGYVFPNWRTEIEYIVNNNFSYKQDPLFQGGTTGAINSRIQGNTILSTTYYEFLDKDNAFRPFIGASIGVSPTKVTNVLSSFAPGSNVANTTTSKSSYNLAWGGSLGVRVQVYSQLYIQGAARYIRLGRIALNSEGGFNSLKLKGNRSLIVGSFGIIALL